MKNWYEVANKCFIDKFDLPLCEDALNDFYTLNEIKQEVNKRIIKLATLGTTYNIPPEYIAEYKIANESEAVATVEPIAAHKYRFTISKPAARRSNEKYLDAIIYHELCHILQIEFLVAMNVLDFIEGVLYYNPEERDTASTLYDKADGHTALWYMFVNHINYTFVVNPPIARFLNLKEAKDISDIFLEETFAKKEWIPVERKVFVDDFSYLFKDEASKED
jgi:hypothetical protein